MPTRRNLLVQGNPEGLAGRDGGDLAQELDPNPGGLGLGRGGRRLGVASEDLENAHEDRNGAAEAHAGLIIPLVRPASQGLRGHLTPESGYD